MQSAILVFHMVNMMNIGDNLTMSYGFACGSYDCAVAYSDFSDGGYGADEDALTFSVSASL